MLQRLLLFLVAVQWISECGAESTIPAPNRSNAPSSVPSASAAGWKLPESLTNWKLPDSVQIHGFASQNYLYTSANQFFGHTTNTGSLDFTEMGINGSWRPLSNLQTSLQVVYRRAGRTDDSDLRIDFGFLDYSFLSGSEYVAGVRLGRVVNPYGLYNDTRDMPFTRPSILLPQSIYFDINRNFALSGDGIQLYGEHHSEIGDFFLQVNGFYSRMDDPSFKADFAKLVGLLGGSGIDLEAEPSWMARLIYEWNQGKIRLAVTGAELNAEIQPKGGHADLKDGYFSFSPILFSAQYNSEFWSLTSEYAIRGTSLTGIDPLVSGTSYTGESFYIQGSYRFLDDLEGYLRYDVVYEDVNDRNGKKFAAESGEPASRGFAKDLTAGLRWDVTPWFMLRAEYHHINGTNWISPLENQGGTRQHWDMFGVSASFRF